MNFHKLLTQRAADDNPVRVGLIGCGKFGTMFLTQALQTTGLHVVGIADLNIKRAQHNLSTAGWDRSRFDAKSLDTAFQSGTTYVGDDAAALIAYERLDVIIEAPCRDRTLPSCHPCRPSRGHGERRSRRCCRTPAGP